MSAASSSDDLIIRCLLAGDSMRLVAVTSTDLCSEICRRHETTGAMAVALSRATTAGLLLATLTKGDEKVSLHIAGEGDLGTLMVDANSSGDVRAYPKRRGVEIGVPAKTHIKLAPATGAGGIVSVARDLGMKEHFTGRTAFSSGEIDDDIERYLVTSEQIDSVLVADAALDENGQVLWAGGLLLQAMPGGEHQDTLAQERTRLHMGGFFAALMASSGLGPEDLARKALGELGADLRLLETRPVQFSCHCSRERAEATIALLGEREITAILSDPGVAEVVCEFCRTTYHFSSENLDALRASMSPPAGRPS
jgi:molecular chaperone Hsp33